MSKAEILAHLWKVYENEESGLMVTVWQQQPWTAVRVCVCMLEYPILEAFGFAKVRYPDRWCAKRGVELAVRKALAECARKIVVRNEEHTSAPASKD